MPSMHTNDSIDEIINRYSTMVYRLAFSQVKNKSDAEDIFQEVFLRYIRHDKAFESQEHIKAWLLRVTINCCKKLWSSGWFKHTTALEETIVFNEPAQNELYHTIAQLPPKYRSVIHLFYYEDLPVEQISTILKTKPATVRTWLSRGRAMLKEKLKGEVT